jgi:hypothetical protein
MPADGAPPELILTADTFAGGLGPPAFYFRDDKIELRKTGWQTRSARVIEKKVWLFPSFMRERAAAREPHFSSRQTDMKTQAVKTLCLVGLAVVVMLAGTNAVQAQSIPVANPLFELPNTMFATPEVSLWETIPPQGSNNATIGVFTNDPAFGTGAYITNCAGTQAAFMYSDPGLVLYQMLPATYTAGAGYQLTAGIIGGPPSAEYPVPASGAIMQMSLFYLSGTNMITVGYTNVVNTTNTFSNIIQLVNFQLDIPPVQSTSAWAGKNIGVAFSTILPNGVQEGGTWELNNVQLFGIPCLFSPSLTNSQFSATLKSEPGEAFQILSSTNISTPLTKWSNVATLTNTTGSAPFVDPSAGTQVRFYSAHELP